jgi:hypothetical protein
MWPPMRGLPLLLVALLASCGDAPPTSADNHPVDAGGASDASSHDAGEQDGGAVPGALCDPRLATSCDADQKCVTTRWMLEAAWPAPRCVTDLAGLGQPEGESCFSAPGQADGCGSGLACTNFGSGEGFCRRTCARHEACSEGEVCVTVAATSGFALCLDTCTDDDSCGAGGWLKCVERDGLHYCESTRAAP